MWSRFVMFTPRVAQSYHIYHCGVPRATACYLRASPLVLTGSTDLFTRSAVITTSMSCASQPGSHCHAFVPSILHLSASCHHSSSIVTHKLNGTNDCPYSPRMTSHPLSVPFAFTTGHLVQHNDRRTRRLQCHHLNFHPAHPTALTTCMTRRLHNTGITSPSPPSPGSSR